MPSDPLTGSPPTPPLRFSRGDKRPPTGWRSLDVLRAAAIVIAMYVVLQLLWFANQLVFLGFLGLLFGLAASDGVDRLQKHGIRRGVGAVIVVFGTVGLVVGAFIWSAPVLEDQSKELREKLPVAIDRIDQYLEENPEGLIAILAGRGENAADRDSLARARVSAADSGLAAVPSMGAGPPPTRLRVALVRQMSSLRTYLFPFLTSTLEVMAGCLVLLFLTIYIAVEPDLYHRGLMHLFPHRSRARAGQVLSAMGVTMRRWFLTQVIAMVVMGAVSWLAFRLIGIPAAFPLGLFAGLMEFIPTIGPIVSAIPAILMGFIQSPGQALVVLAVCTALQQLEGQLLIPLLMKEGVDLPPVLTILAQALMALIFGLLGLLVAVPLLAAIVVGVKLLYVEDVVGDQIDLPGEDVQIVV